MKRLLAAVWAALLICASIAQAKDLVFAAIGDYGVDLPSQARVAKMIDSWNVDFIITLGDNNYNSGAAETIDRNIGKYFHAYIHPYSGTFGGGSPDGQNRFFPSLGNHDWRTKDAKPYLDYFTLPGNERYYEFVRGPLHFFALDSDAREPDGTLFTSKQGRWFEERARASTARFKIAYFHHPPYSSNRHGPTRSMRWPFAELGIDVVMSGHDHAYERLRVKGVSYIVNGSGGGEIYAFGATLPETITRYAADHGALRGTYNELSGKLRLEFWSVSTGRIDSLWLEPR